MAKGFRERLGHTLGQWKKRIQPLLNDLNRPMSISLQEEMVTREAGEDYALIAMTTGIVGFNKDNTPIIRKNMIDPAMQKAFRNNMAMQHMVVNLLEAEFGAERAGIGKQTALGEKDEKSWVQRAERANDVDSPPLPPQ